MDGFDKHQATGKACECGKRSCGFVAAQGDALEAFELAHGLLDAGTALVEDIGKEAGHVAGRASMRDHRTDAARTRRSPVAARVVAFVSRRGAGSDIRPDVEESFELAAIARFAAGQMECERLAVEVALEMDLGREPASRAAERLIRLPPLAPAAETCARTTVLSNICTR